MRSSCFKIVYKNLGVAPSMAVARFLRRFAMSYLLKCMYFSEAGIDSKYCAVVVILSIFQNYDRSQVSHLIQNIAGASFSSNKGRSEKGDLSLEIGNQLHSLTVCQFKSFLGSLQSARLIDLIKVTFLKCYFLLSPEGP